MLTLLCPASHTWDLTNSADPVQIAASEQGLHCLHTGISIKIKFEMKKYTRHPLIELELMFIKHYVPNSLPLPVNSHHVLFVKRLPKFSKGHNSGKIRIKKKKKNRVIYSLDSKVITLPKVSKVFSHFVYAITNICN